MKYLIFLLVALINLTESSYAAITVSFEFDTADNAINGNTALADSHDAAIDEAMINTPFSLDVIRPGLVISISPSQNDISYTVNGLGVGTNGTLSASGDALTFSFNQAISLDFLDVGDFTGTGATGEDALTLSYSNGNADVTLVGGDFDNNTSDFINFSSGNSLAANESFTISRVDGSFAIEGFTITVIPEPSSSFLLGFSVLPFLLRRRR